MHWTKIKTTRKMNGIIKHILQVRKTNVDNYIVKRIFELEKQNKELNELIRLRESTLLKLLFKEKE